jgi:4a-hydroxytetrahydrobiopterin dehydratase
MARLLTTEEIERGLRDLPAWTGDAQGLRREARAPDFPSAIAVVDEVARVAEQMNHHPDIDIRWRTLRFAVVTHSAGGVTRFDVELARRIEQILGERGAAG